MTKKRKKKQYREGAIFSKHLLYVKEDVEVYYQGGRVVKRAGVFRCSQHRDFFYRMTFDDARNSNRMKECFCNKKGNVNTAGQFRSSMSENSIGYLDYRKDKASRAVRAEKYPPDFIKVTDDAIYVYDQLFYSFGKANHDDPMSIDRRIAYNAENKAWNYPSRPELILVDISNKFHDNKWDFSFRSNIWDIGAGSQVLLETILIPFKEIQNNERAIRISDKKD